MKVVFEKSFYDHILDRGHDYYYMDKVCDVEVDGPFVRAIVKGSETYAVTLTIENGVFIDGECSCPYFESGEYCKHMAAVLYYLSHGDVVSNPYSLWDVVHKIDEAELKQFIYNNLVGDSNLLNRFRVQFSHYFPKLSKKDYQNKVYNSIRSCCDRHGFIDYSSAGEYEGAMFEYVRESEKLIDRKDYDTAFTIITTLLDSIPRTDIDDSNGSTGMVADSCIDLIHDIIDEIHGTDEDILKRILDYTRNEIETSCLCNYGIDLKEILEYFIGYHLYLDDIESSLLKGLEASRKKEYFYGRTDYIEYLIQIYKFHNQTDKIMNILEEFSFDRDICMKYVDKLMSVDRKEDAIELLKGRLGGRDFENRFYADKLSQIYFDNQMQDEYRDILYDVFYKYSKYSFDTYLKIKALYSKEEWATEKSEIIHTIMNDSGSCSDLNKIYIEEEMYDELFMNISEYHMDYIKPYEKYLLPKYQKELLDIYKHSCLHDAERASNRKEYRNVAIAVNYIIHMEGSHDTVQSLLKKIHERYFRNRPAMLDEFKSVIKNLSDYIK